MRKYTENEKSIITSRYNNGESVADLVRDTHFPRSTIYAWIKETADRDFNKKSVSLKNYRILENKVMRLQGIMSNVRMPRTDTRHRSRRNWFFSIIKPFWS